MTAILGIATYIPEDRQDWSAASAFAVPPGFLDGKIGTARVARKKAAEDTSDLCCAVFAALQRKIVVPLDRVACLVVVTQNPDGCGLPHTAAAVHAKIGAPSTAATFDLSQGCAGYIYGLSVVGAFLASQNADFGLLFTCDPYSKIVDPADRDTALLFGDAASVTLIGRTGTAGAWAAHAFRFQSVTGERTALENRSGKLYMNGRGIFNFAATVVPREVKAVLCANNLAKNDVDKYLFHQGSKYIVETLAHRLDLPSEAVPQKIQNIGNTVSSSIPLVFEDLIDRPELRRMLMCGFGVGLSVATCLVERSDN